MPVFFVCLFVFHLLCFFLFLFVTFRIFGKSFFQLRVSVLVVFFIGRFNEDYFLVVCLTCVLMSVFHGYGQRL